LSGHLSDKELGAVGSLIDRDRGELLRLVCELISVSSVNPPGDERAVAEVLKAAIERLGLGRVETLALDSRRPNVVCRVQGCRDGPTLILNGHMDTVQVGEPKRWDSEALSPRVLDGQLFGLGAADMKAGLGAMVYAASVMSQLRDTWGGTLMLVFSADEEWGSHYGTEHLVKQCGLSADAVVVCEPSGLEREFDSLHIACRGITRFKFIVLGTSRHSGFSYLPGTVNASLEMAWLLEMAREHLRFGHAYHDLYPQGVSVNLGLRVDAGVGYGIVPQRAESLNEIRTLPGMTRKQIEEVLREFVSSCRGIRPGLKLDVVFETPPHDWIPGVEIGPHEPIVESALRAARAVLPEAPRLSGYPATTDARFFSADGGIPAIAAFGPGLITLAHAPNERVPVESVVNAAKIYSLMAMDYLDRAARLDARMGRAEGSTSR
jgi:acetylornithine deacetylase